MSCTCQSCGRKYKVDLLVPNRIWEKIRPEGKPKRGGLLCGICIIERVEVLNKCTYLKIGGGMALTISSDNVPVVGDVVKKVKLSKDGEVMWATLKNSAGREKVVVSHIKK